MMGHLSRNGEGEIKTRKMVKRQNVEQLGSESRRQAGALGSGGRGLTLTTGPSH